MLSGIMTQSTYNILTYWLFGFWLAWDCPHHRETISQLQQRLLLAIFACQWTSRNLY